MKNSEIKEGLIGAFYTQKGYFLKIKPAYGIGKVKWSFVKLNTNGQGFDIYMDMDTMDNLADDVLSYRLAKKIEEERAAKAEYPQCFEFITGEKGTKIIKIGSGNYDVRIQGTVNKKTYANLPCSYGELKTAMKWFKRTSKKYFDDCTKTILEEAERYYKEHPVSEDIEKETSPVPHAEEDAQKGSNSVQEEIKKETFTFHTRSNVENGKVQVKIDGFNQIGTLVFPEEIIPTLTWFKQFEVATEKESKEITCICTRENGTFTFIECVKKK